MKTNLLGLCALLLFSCTNEDFLETGKEGKACDYISFGIAPYGHVQTKGSTRTDAQTYATSTSLILRSPDTADTLCMRATVTDGIEGSGRKAITRGTPVTADGFYNQFQVLALQDDAMRFNQTVTQSGSNWTTEDTYYWPGADHTLSFYAWAPATGSFTDTPTGPDDLDFTYTVPEAATDQKDLVVAKRENIQGDYKQAVNLTFYHLCTAVKFVVGNEIQPGTIERVALKGVKYEGTFDLGTATDPDNAQWTLNENTRDFTQLLKQTTTGNETEGTEITSGESTFMMLPQTLPEGATVEVVFTDDNGTRRTLSADIGGMEWPMGKTVTYKLSITPAYEFKLEDENPTLDAHYEIFKTNLIVTDVPAGTAWTITADNNATIQNQSEMNDWAKQGYWTDSSINSEGDRTGSARGKMTYQGTGSGKFPITIFVPENIGDETRTVKLTVTLGGKTIQTLTINQLSPSWYGSFGCERIEGDKEPWGFYWESDYKLVYDLRSCDNDSRESIRQYISWTKFLHGISSLLEGTWLEILFTWIFGDDIPDLSFVDMDTSHIGGLIGGQTIADEITIDLGSLIPSGIAEKIDNGPQNTRDIYNFKGIQLVNEIISRIENIPGYQLKEIGTGIFPTNNAAIACMKLNSWNIVTVSIPLQEDQEILKLTSETDMPDWFLPASGEVKGINDNEYPLEDYYWTSTSVTNSSTHAYKYDASGNTSHEQRDQALHVRAVRKNPNN